MSFSIPIQRAARIVRAGGVIAYPTEGVFGLGCDPSDGEAVARILAIKRRDPAMGLVIIAATPQQLEGWIDRESIDTAEALQRGDGITWIAPADTGVPYWIRGDHDGVAVRITTHPIAAALCTAADTTLVSTSANVHGRLPTRSRFVLRRNFGDLVDYIVPGDCGDAEGPSEIRVLGSGRVVRPAAS